MGFVLDALITLNLYMLLCIYMYIFSVEMLLLATWCCNLIGICVFVLFCQYNK